MSILHHNTATLYRDALKNDHVLQNFPLDLLPRYAHVSNRFKENIVYGWVDHKRDLRDQAQSDGLIGEENTDRTVSKKYYALLQNPVLILSDEINPKFHSADFRTGTLIFPVQDCADEFEKVVLPLTSIEAMLIRQYERTHKDVRKNPPLARDYMPLKEDEKKKNPHTGLEKAAPPPPPQRDLYEECRDASDTALSRFAKITGRDRAEKARAFFSDNAMDCTPLLVVVDPSGQKAAKPDLKADAQRFLAQNNAPRPN